MALLLFTLQLLLLGYFLYFAFFNYLYAIASFFYRAPDKKRISGKRIAVVIVSFNEKEVMMETLRACEQLTYPNKVILVGDDSNDGETYPLLADWIQKRGGKQTPGHFVNRHHKNADIWQTPDGKLMVFHRHTNAGFKAGNLKEVTKLLKRLGIEYMYLLDADWQPQPDALELALSELESNDNLAYVQTRRLHYNRLSGIFQHAASLSEETEYEVELIGRQVMRHPILFTGCCTLFRLRAIEDAGGFTPGHLTEDIDLTNRLYLRGWHAAYLPGVSNQGEIVPSYPALVRQQERWAQGSARSFKDFVRSVINSVHMTVGQRFSLVRQNMYYTTALAIELSIALALIIVVWLALVPESYQANLFILYMSRIGRPYQWLLMIALASNIFPITIAILKRRHYHEIFFVPFSTWLSWSLIHTYFWANVKGLAGVQSNWFKTPKTSGKKMNVVVRRSSFRLIINLLSSLAFALIYGLEWSYYGYLDPYAYFWVPAMTVSIFLH